MIATRGTHDIAGLAAGRIDAAARICDQHYGGALSGRSGDRAQDRVRSPVRSNRQFHLLADRAADLRPGDGLEGLYAAYAGDEPGHGLDHFSGPGVSGPAAAQFSALRRYGADARFQHGCQLHHQHGLAGLWRRDDAIELQPDGGNHLPDVHLGHHRLRGRHGVHPRLHGEGRRCRPRQFLPGPGPLHHARADACFVRARVADDSARRAADPRRRHHRAYGAGSRPDDRARSGGLVRDHQAPGHQRRPPTPPIPTRIRPQSPT